MTQKVKGRIYFFALGAIVASMFWSIWAFWRPRVLYTTCSDIAVRTGAAAVKRDILAEEESVYQETLDECLHQVNVNEETISEIK